jgi:hypothetical protein
MLNDRRRVAGTPTQRLLRQLGFHSYQNIEKKWSLELDKILTLGLYCISVWTM